MKKPLIITSLLLIFGSGYSQNKFQPLIQRIALLELYLGYLKSGYKVVQGGLNTFRDLKNGEFGLHKDYFDGLSVVKPKIKEFSKVAAIISLSLQLVRECNTAQEAYKNSNDLTAQESDWLVQTHTRFITDCNESVDLLIDVITDGRLNLTDDQRLIEIEKLHEAMIAKAGFCRRFNSGAKSLILQRANEVSEIRKMQYLYQIK